MTTWPRAMPALITPFTAEGELDLDAQRRNVALLVDRGARGVVVAGSTGEGPYLEPGDREKLTASAREVAPEIIIVCGVHAESTRQAIAAVGEASAGGADAALVVSPTSLVRKQTDLIIDHYRDVADHASIPVLMYSVPSVTSYELDLDVVLAGATHESIVGIKDSGGDPSRIPRMVSNDGFIAYAGASRALADSAAAGAWGAITATGNYALADVSLAARGDRQAQSRLTATAAAIEQFGVAGTKYASSLVGLLPGTMRRPLRPLDPDGETTVKAALAQAGLLSQ